MPLRSCQVSRRDLARDIELFPLSLCHNAMFESSAPFPGPGSAPLPTARLEFRTFWFAALIGTASTCPAAATNTATITTTITTTTTTTIPALLPLLLLRVPAGARGSLSGGHPSQPLL